MKICQRCGFKNNDDARFCVSCGNNIENCVSVNTCPKCGHQIEENAKFCGKCGNRLEDSSEPPQQIEPEIDEAYDLKNYQFALDFKRAHENLNPEATDIIYNWMLYSHKGDDAYFYFAFTILYGSADKYGGDKSKVRISELKSRYEKGLESKYHDEELYNWYKNEAERVISNY